jgi:SPASM domain peptide maturase of grasp-with-spasm system
MKTTEYFKLFSHNIPVKGLDKSVIYNLQKSNLTFIPNSLYELLNDFKTKPVLKVYELFTDETDKKTFNEYLSFLQKNQLGFYTENIEEYPDISKQWKCPNDILNANIEFDFFEKKYDLINLLKQLDDLMCFHLEIRLKNANINDLKELAISCSEMVFRSIGLIIDYSKSIEINMDDFFEEYEKLESIIIYNTPSEINSIKFPERINYLTGDIIEQLKNIDFPLDHYVLNIKYFTEAQTFHPYYNKKVCVNNLGEIKNCLRHDDVFGNINNNTIMWTLQNTVIKDLWYACPDKVIDYQNDELRYCKFYTQKLHKISPNLYTTIK